MKLLVAAALAATSLCVLPSVASAQDVSESGLYGNVVVANANLDAGFDDVNLVAIGVRVGYEFNRYIAIEGEAAVGLDGDSLTVDVPPPVTVDFDLEHEVAVYVVGQFPLNDSFSVFGRVGYGTQEISAQSSGPSFDVSDESFNFGGGVRWFLTPQDALQVDYTHHEFQEGDNSGVFAISYMRRFR